jgi:hypothetical protein
MCKKIRDSTICCGSVSISKENFLIFADQIVEFFEKM